ncbi:hypothetical protein CKO45_27930 [Paracraurococcus ruber]|uniref:Periplasmic heavy metal sensor n=1 Tax=Paracraurococcus ruber TaxID=77675 RepID=A0ABS1D573_9PROT|nr:hypothetical protein [Paracraurococcus ruber]
MAPTRHAGRRREGEPQGKGGDGGQRPPAGRRPAGAAEHPADRGGPALIRLPPGLPSGRALLGAALGASLVLNVALGALLWTRPQPVEPRGRGFDRMVSRIEHTLPAEDRPAFRQVLERERESYAAELAAFRAANRMVDEAMGREPFDPDALRTALDAWSARWAEFNLAFTGALVKAMAVVSPAGRQQIAAARREARR